jgi:hypothetical protein
MSGPPVCEECGYALAGVGEGRAQAQCPECGFWFDPRRPFAPLPWPGRPRLLWSMCWPTLIVTLLTTTCTGGIAMGGGEFGAGLPACVLLWMCTAFGVPTAVATDLTTPRVARARRNRVRWTLAFAGIAANLLLTLILLAAIISALLLASTR